MKKRFFLSLALVSLLVFTGCYSLSTYQNADTVREGKFAGGIGVGVTQLADSDPDTTVDDIVNEFLADSQIVEFFLRYGLTENMDMGVKLSSLHLSLDWKWRVLDLGIFKIATDFGGVYTNLFSILTGWALFGNVIFDISPVDSISIYFGPKYQYTSLGFGDQSFLDQHYYGVFIGFRFQLGVIAFMPEVAFYKIALSAEDINASADDGFLFQPGVAIQFGF